MSAGATSMCSAELCLPSWAPSMWCVRCSAPMSVLSNCPWQQWRSCMEWFLKDYRSDQIASLWIAPQNIFQKRSFMFFRTSLLRLVNLLFPVSLLRKILRSAWINYKLIKMNDGMIFMRKKKTFGCFLNGNGNVCVEPFGFQEKALLVHIWEVVIGNYCTMYGKYFNKLKSGSYERK